MLSCFALEIRLSDWLWALFNEFELQKPFKQLQITVNSISARECGIRRECQSVCLLMRANERAPVIRLNGHEVSCSHTVRVYTHAWSPNLALLRLFKRSLLNCCHSCVCVCLWESVVHAVISFLALLKLSISKIADETRRTNEWTKARFARSHLISILRLRLIVPMWAKWMGFHLCNDLSPTSTPTDHTS